MDSAPAIWDLMQEMVETMPETPGSSVDFHDSVDKAKIVTERLRVNIITVRAGDPAADRRALRDNAHLFVKVSQPCSSTWPVYIPGTPFFANADIFLVFLRGRLS